MISLVNSTNTFEEAITSILNSFVQNVQEEGILLGSFYEVGIALIPKPKSVHDTKATDQ